MNQTYHFSSRKLAAELDDKVTQDTDSCGWN